MFTFLQFYSFLCFLAGLYGAESGDGGLSGSCLWPLSQRALSLGLFGFTGTMFNDIRRLQGLYEIDESIPEPECFANQATNYNPCGRCIQPQTNLDKMTGQKGDAVFYTFRHDASGWLCSAPVLPESNLHTYLAL